MILGIDPGLHGALAWLRPDGTVRAIGDIPVLDGEISAALMFGDPQITTMMGQTTAAIIEWPGLMPVMNNNAKTIRSMGMSLGTLQAVCASWRVPTFRRTPSVWKKAMGLTRDKEECRARAIRQWPNFEPQFRRKKDADRAEAALLAYYWLTKGTPLLDHAATITEPVDAHRT